MTIQPLSKAGRLSTDSSFINVEAWADETVVQAIESLVISSPPPNAAVAAVATPERKLLRGTSVALEIPLDDSEVKPLRLSAAGGSETRPEGLTPRSELRRRDSLKRREALLKGKDGSRRRQRWENDRLLHNPYAEPPLPSDWEVRPTYPVHAVPYYLAPLWDVKYAQRAADRSKAKSKNAKARGTGPDASVTEADVIAARIQKDVRLKLKKSRGAKAFLQDLEEQVRSFVQKWEQEQVNKPEQEDDVDLLESSDEDDEVVFVGRNGQCKDMRLPRKSSSAQRAEREQLVFDSLEEDAGASFGRWLVHSIATYYGLETWSVTVGSPARREAYVGIKEMQLKTGSRDPNAVSALPRPLWALV